MRALAAGLAAVLCLVLSGCDDAGSAHRVTFRGTQEAQSMEPTLKRGDRIIATEVPASGPSVGDVVVYRNPGHWLGYRKAGEGTLVHRVIGTPGDTVVCCDADGRVSLNGKPLDEPYLHAGLTHCNAPLLTSLEGDCDWRVGPVPDGMLFVMGDNRENAADSRFHMCPEGVACDAEPWVPIDRVRGVVKLPKTAQ